MQTCITASLRIRQLHKVIINPSGVFVKENISGRYRIAQILDEGFLLLFTAASYGCIETDESRYTVQIYVFSVRGEYVIIKNQSTKIDIFYHHNNKRK